MKIELYISPKTEYLESFEEKNVLYFVLWEYSGKLMIKRNYKTNDDKALKQICELNYCVFVRRLKYTKDKFFGELNLIQSEKNYCRKHLF